MITISPFLRLCVEGPRSDYFCVTEPNLRIYIIENFLLYSKYSGTWKLALDFDIFWLSRALTGYLEQEVTIFKGQGGRSD